jgi:hypothetical protein
MEIKPNQPHYRITEITVHKLEILTHTFLCTLLIDQVQEGTTLIPPLYIAVVLPSDLGVEFIVLLYCAGGRPLEIWGLLPNEWHTPP